MRVKYSFSYREVDITTTDGQELAKRHFVSAVPARIIDGRVTFVNAAAARTLGASAGDLVGSEAHTTFHAPAPDGTPLMLRERSGDFTRDLISEASGFDDEPGLLAAAPLGSCSRDACVASIRKDGREYRLLATRSATRIDWKALVAACREADIVVSDRWLPRDCTPGWLKLDVRSLRRTGGISVYLGRKPRVETVAERIGQHPWSALTRD